MSKLILVSGPLVGALAFLVFGVIILTSATPSTTNVWAVGLNLILAAAFAYWAYTWIKSPPGAEAFGLGDRAGQALKQLPNVKKIAGKVVDIKHLTNIRVNGQAPYIIFAKSTDATDTKTYSSAKVWSDPHFALTNQTNVDIYVDPANGERYYLDLPTIGINNQR